jgi:hypothetical protein
VAIVYLSEQKTLTLPEVLYFIITCTAATLAAGWVYVREGWILAVVTFTVVWGPCVRFFFTGGFGRLLHFCFTPYDRKD